MKRNHIHLIFLLFFIFTALNTGTAKEPEVTPDLLNPIVIGLNADMSSGSAQSGIAIYRGMRIAIKELNNGGGLLGRRLAIKVMDHRGIPARGRFNMKKLNSTPNVVAVMGGLHTPVVLAEKKKLFDTEILKIPYLIPWAAGTPVTDSPWIFRLSVRDEYAGGFLVNSAISRGYKKIALLLETTAWGRSNEKSMTAALVAHNLAPSMKQWFSWKVDKVKIAKKLELIYQSGAEAIMLVANAPEGATIVQAMAERSVKKRIPIISHWGITGGNFPNRVGPPLHMVDLTFLQTYSFLSSQENPIGQRVLNMGMHLFPEEIRSREDFFSPVGTAHAYDLIHILALAIQKVQTTNRGNVRNALENLKEYKGLIRSYSPPFKPGQGSSHDALDTSDYQMSKFAFNIQQKRWIITPENSKGKY